MLRRVQDQVHSWCEVEVIEYVDWLWYNLVQSGRSDVVAEAKSKLAGHANYRLWHVNNSIVAAGYAGDSTGTVIRFNRLMPKYGDEHQVNFRSALSSLPIHIRCMMHLDDVSSKCMSCASLRLSMFFSADVLGRTWARTKETWTEILGGGQLHYCEPRVALGPRVQKSRICIILPLEKQPRRPNSV
jgi:hypothetical protein